MNAFKTRPVATLVSVMTAVLAVLVYLQTTDVVSGQVQQWLTVAAGILNVLLGLYARSQVTPVADPRDAEGRALVAAKPSTPGWRA